VRRRITALAIAVVALAAAGPPTANGVEVEPGVEWTTIVRQRPAERINVLAVDPARVRGVLSNERIAGRERVSAMGRRVGAVAGVNGTLFARSGDPVGALAIDGELLSEPQDGRSALILPAASPGAGSAASPGAGSAASPSAGSAAAARPLIARVRFRGRMYVNGRSREIDGIDRTRGLIPACGGRGGDVPTIRPNQVLTCTDSSELVVLSPLYGMRPPAEGGVEAIVRNGTVTSVRPPGIGGVPGDGLLLTGTGDAAAFLRNAALPRSRAEIALRLIAGDRQFALAPGGRAAAGSAAGGTPDASAGATAPEAGPAVVVGAGPRLLSAGKVAVAADAEGFAPPQAPAFFRSFVASRNPRTLAGVRADGTLLLVTVDGRAPGWSVGMTLREAARLMRSLGALDALNLDGGGSTAMTVRGELVNRPSDRVGGRPVERRVSNGLFVMP
jgi:Phosphodiester glycosidase